MKCIFGLLLIISTASAEWVGPYKIRFVKAGNSSNPVIVELGVEGSTTKFQYKSTFDPNWSMDKAKLTASLALTAKSTGDDVYFYRVDTTPDVTSILEISVGQGW